MRAPALATTALLACLALVGCESDPVGPVDPDDTATPSQPSTTPTPTGPTPPVLPEAANANTAQGVVLFARHYVSLLNYAANTGNVEVLREVSADCKGCDGYVSLYSRIYGDGGYYRTPGWSPTSLTPSEIEGSFGVEVVVRAPAAEYRETATSEVFRTAPTKYTLLMTARQEQGAWRLVSLREGKP